MVDRVSEWAEPSDGTVADLQRALAEIRDAGCPGGADASLDVGVFGGVTLVARWTYDNDDDDDDGAADPDGGAERATPQTRHCVMITATDTT